MVTGNGASLGVIMNWIVTLSSKKEPLKINTSIQSLLIGNSVSLDCKKLELLL